MKEILIKIFFHSQNALKILGFDEFIKRFAELRVRRPPSSRMRQTRIHLYLLKVAVSVCPCVCVCVCVCVCYVLWLQWTRSVWSLGYK